MRYLSKDATSNSWTGQFSGPLLDLEFVALDLQEQVLFKYVERISRIPQNLSRSAIILAVLRVRAKHRADYIKKLILYR